MNVCPVYRRVGGSAYGSAYMGPIGSTVTPGLLGAGVADELPFASTLCGACQAECPVKIDLPHQLVYLRSRAVQAGSGGGSAERRIMGWWAGAMVDSRAYRRAASVARITAYLTAWLPWKPWPLSAWARHRSMPRMAAQSFKEWWRGAR